MSNGSMWSRKWVKLYKLYVLLLTSGSRPVLVFAEATHVGRERRWAAERRQDRRIARGRIGKTPGA